MSNNDTTANVGQAAENMAARFLEKHGLTVLTRNYRCRGGEIDLVCQTGKTLVFVEVRFRRNPNFGGAGASITFTKQKRIILAAQHYLLANKQPNCDCRFDCLLLNGMNEQNIDWIPNAFSSN